LLAERGWRSSQNPGLPSAVSIHMNRSLLAALTGATLLGLMIGCRMPADPDQPRGGAAGVYPAGEGEGTTGLPSERTDPRNPPGRDFGRESHPATTGTRGDR
jgi:hypothetical protein